MVAEIVPEITQLMMLLMQDCVYVVVSYPFRIETLEIFDPIGDFDVSRGVMFGK
jgi:hypothetical protein